MVGIIGCDIVVANGFGWSNILNYGTTAWGLVMLKN